MGRQFFCDVEMMYSKNSLLKSWTFRPPWCRVVTNHLNKSICPSFLFVALSCCSVVKLHSVNFIVTPMLKMFTIAMLTQWDSSVHSNTLFQASLFFETQVEMLTTNLIKLIYSKWFISSALNFKDTVELPCLCNPFQNNFLVYNKGIWLSPLCILALMSMVTSSAFKNQKPS